MHEHPDAPYRWHAFLSYTTREEELTRLRPWLEEFVGQLIEEGVGVSPLWIDELYLGRGRYHDAELARRLSEAIHQCAFTIAMLSPAYPDSHWCCFEWGETERIHATRGAPATALSILPLCWKRPVRLGMCMQPIEQRKPWQDVDASDRATVRDAVRAASKYARAWGHLVEMRGDQRTGGWV